MVYGQITFWLCPSVAQIAKSFDKALGPLGPSLCCAFGQVGYQTFSCNEHMNTFEDQNYEAVANNRRFELAAFGGAVRKGGS